MIKIKVPRAYKDVASAALGDLRYLALTVAKDFDFTSTEIALQPNYYDGFTRLDGSPKRVLVRDYLDAPDDAAYADAMCVEMPAPKDFTSQITLHVGRSAPAGNHAICLIHAGRTGSIAPLHFDWDHKWVLHVCLSGRKTFYVLPPDAGWLLNPVLNTSTICVPRLSGEDCAFLLKRLDGFRVNLAAGEALLFPSLWWHAVRYDAPSMSMSIRFGEQGPLRPFAALPRSFWLQRLVWQLFQTGAPTDSVRTLTRCLETFFHPRRSSLERYHEMYSVYRQCLLELSQSRGTEYLSSHDFNSERFIASAEIKELYSTQPRPRASQATETIEDVRRFLFAGLGSRKLAIVPYKAQRNLAEYARAKRQGLEPRRGLVAIHRAGH